MKKQHDNYKSFSTIAFFIVVFLFCHNSCFAQNNSAKELKIAPLRKNTSCEPTKTYIYNNQKTRKNNLYR